MQRLCGRSGKAAPSLEPLEPLAPLEPLEPKCSYVHAGSRRAVGTFVRRISPDVRADRPRPAVEDSRLWRRSGELQRGGDWARLARCVMRPALSLRDATDSRAHR